MGRSEEMGVERDMLERIVALLLALASLAERAALASGSTRCRVLWALLQADEVTREFVAGRSFNMAGQQWSPTMATVRHDTAPADAMGLAVTLRALAFAVHIMAMRIRSRSNLTLAQACIGSRQIGANGLAEPLSAAFAAVGVCDTS